MNIFTEGNYKLNETKLIAYLESIGKHLDSTVIEKNLPKLISDCRRCSKYAETGGAIPPVLVKDSEILILSRNPNASDDIKGNLFDRSSSIGRLFKKYLEELGIRDRRISITNVVHCPNNRSHRNLPVENDHYNMLVSSESPE